MMFSIKVQQYWIVIEASVMETIRCAMFQVVPASTRCLGCSAWKVYRSDHRRQEQHVSRTAPHIHIAEWMCLHSGHNRPSELTEREIVMVIHIRSQFGKQSRIFLENNSYAHQKSLASTKSTIAKYQHRQIVKSWKQSCIHMSFVLILFRCFTTSRNRLFRRCVKKNLLLSHFAKLPKQDWHRPRVTEIA